MKKTQTRRVPSLWRESSNRDERLRLLLTCFAAVFVLGLAAHAYGFLRAGFSHDMLNALVVTPVETYWKMQLGRPGIVLYRRVLRGLIAAPWQLGLLSLLWLSLSCFLLCDLLSVRSRLFPFLAAGFLTVNLSVIAMTATYLYEMDADLFAMLLGLCAVFLWDRLGWIALLPGVPLLAFCMGTYQSMISVPLTLMLLLCCAALLRGESFSAVFRKGLRALLMLLLGALVYLLSVRLMCAWKGINLAMGSYNDVGQTVSLSLPQRFLRVYQTWADAFWNPAASHIEPLVLVLNCLLPLLALWRLLSWLCTGKAGVREKLLLCVLVLLLPLGMNTAQLGFSGRIHDLMKAAFWLFPVFCLLIVFLVPTQKRPALPRAVAAVLAVIFLCSHIQTANIVYTRKNLEQNAALSLMTRVVYRLEEREDYVPGETPLVFVGVSPQLQEKIPGFEAYYDISGCEESNPLEKSLISYNYNTYAAYFRYILNNPARMADNDSWNRLQTDPRVQKMPVYPEEGCMQLLDGLLVVKMGDPSAKTDRGLQGGQT